MIIVARRISVGELFEIGRVAVVDVVETHRGRSFAGGLLGEARRLRLAVGACADRGLDPGPTSTVSRPSGSGGRGNALSWLGFIFAFELLENAVVLNYYSLRNNGN